MATSRFTRLDSVLATRSDTSFWKTYITAKTKNATVPSPGLPVDARIRETRLLLFLKAYSVLLDDSSSSLGRRNRALTRGMKDALGHRC